jgi:enoyl-CoA hydratase
MNFGNILLETRDAVGIITLNRPKALNALCRGLFDDLALALDDLDANDAIGAIVITGSERAFAAGVDIAEMQDQSYQSMLSDAQFTRDWDRITKCNKPVIAAVAGYALGGGCELAMMCDFIIAADNAKFGQPEIILGTIPGIGGSQRLTRLVGKSKAMDLCLTGRMMDAQEAERSGLVARIEPLVSYLQVAIEAAAQIAALSHPVVKLAKQAVNMALETPLSQGIEAERNMFYSTFGLDDQKEGMSAFVEKRRAQFKHR